MDCWSVRISATNAPANADFAHISIKGARAGGVTCQYLSSTTVASPWESIAHTLLSGTGAS